MKNKKIFTITIAVITLMAGAMLVCSKAIEKAWTTSENTQNNLTANSENITTGETTFDYPYIMVTPEVLSEMYDINIEDFNRTPFVELDTGYRDSIPFQQAANIVGELLKDIFGYTTPSKEPVLIALYNMPNEGLELPENDLNEVPQEDRHLEMTFSNYWNDGKERKAGFDGNLDPYTGKIIFLRWKDLQYINGYDDIDFLSYNLPEKDAHKIYDSEIKNLMRLFGNISPVKEIVYRNVEFTEKIESETSGYIFDVTCEDGSTHTFKFLKIDGVLTHYYNNSMYEGQYMLPHIIFY